MSSAHVGTDTATGSPPVTPGEMRLEVVVVPVLGRRSAPSSSTSGSDGGSTPISRCTTAIASCSSRHQVPSARSSSARASRRWRPARFRDSALGLRHRRGRAGLTEHGVDVSEPFHDVTGIFHHAGTEGRLNGAAPEHADYGSFASFADPDGNGWLLQEVKTRLPGR